MQEKQRLVRKIRVWLWFFVIALFLSGATAIPLQMELQLLADVLAPDGSAPSPFGTWILNVKDALVDTNAKYPFLAYGTDWLAFGHFVIAIAFLGPLRDPVRNLWVIEFGMIACLLIVPYAFVMGGIRGIPIGWRLIDCSFGVFGIIPLWLVRKWILQLQARTESEAAQSPR
jgi:hypothetical protein